MQHVDRCKAGYNIKNKIKVECPDFSYCENHDIYEDLKIAILKIQNECKHEKTTVQHNSIYDGSDISYYCINCGAKKVNNDIFTFAENEFAYKALRKLKVR
ncbi:MAG: hypothetical protein GTO45_22275 [Candidatus Aminicenantes bacterium]|nr:hypothetical protein [Candidatus Aminicenantes bacterium]NIM84082.1 hypothetical protein [Candidatus Aminicenantes bacterium]NIN20862.1 hypothetical protein [Candidatus Aminicenantes bacterium]NIN44683.1 hypothetical protein [Candidatus Aminicenantes bacterium]NIN87491.1 hypothetical protein [Candidatus Aminicenantes bacterium]